jgi:transcriptional regulator with XRE-family HTH domain
MTTTQQQHQHPDDVRVVPDWELCDRLARSLRLLPLSHGEIAEVFGVNPTTVSRWLNGHNKPSNVALMFWADMTGVDFEWLKTGEASPEWVRLQNQRACRDSNPKPSVWEPVVIEGGQSVKRGLTVFGPLAMYGALRPVASL